MEVMLPQLLGMQSPSLNTVVLLFSTQNYSDTSEINF